MKDVERVWREKSDEELLKAAEQLSDFTEDARTVLIDELEKRGLPAPSQEDINGQEVAGIVQSMLDRYSDAYRVADAVTGMGSFVKGIGGLLGLALILLGLGCSSGSSVLFIVLGVITGFLFFIVGVVVSAVGQVLKANVDTAVNTSPFIYNDDKAYIMGLD